MAPTDSPSILRRRSFLAGVPVVVATLLLAACGGGGGSGGGDEQTAPIRTGPVTTTTVPATVEAEQAPVTVEGEPLPELPDSGDDPAVGETAPVVSGTSFAGTPLTVGKQGRPYLAIFLAHWCPHCQAEVPKVGPWIAEGGLPDGVDAYAVATSTRSDYPNYPPSAWLRKEKWPTEVLVDSEDFAAANAYGLSAFPFYVLVDGDGKVVERFSGEVDLGELQHKVDALVAE